jgi:hypothetical protein
MRNRLVHARKSQPRTYRGEAEAAGLLNWLNIRNPTDLIRQAKADVESVMELVKSLPAASQKLSKTDLKDQAKLNVALMEYTFSNRVDYDESSGRKKWNLSENGEVSSLRDLVSGEAESIAWIRNLDEMGRLTQVRKCNCGQYFFDRYPKREPSERRFHSAKCRVKYWEKSEKRKKEKREKAKANYWSQKDRESRYLRKRKTTARKSGG